MFAQVLKYTWCYTPLLRASLIQVTGELLALLKSMADTDGRYYPARGGTTYIINTPPLFAMVSDSVQL
jgi:hypothetical protein